MTEAMLSVQMIGVHNAAVNFMVDATSPNQTFEGKDANVFRTTRLMRLFNEQLEAMAKLKGKTTQQRVVVEHVHVNAGGQAIVGAVTAGKQSKGEGTGEGN
jgi:ABC-type branched-subunit amino acid transport system substrate-binding protein